MKRRVPILLLALAVTPLPTLAADDGTWFGDNSADGAWMLGMKGGNLVNEGSGFQDAANRGVVLGYTFARPVGKGSASVEFEFTDTYTNGDVDSLPVTGGTGEWSMESKAIYMAYRTGGTIYFKGKVGAVLADLKSRPTQDPLATTTSNESALASVGGGVGVRFGKVASIEFEYTGGMGDNDVTFVSLGAMLNF